MIHKMYAEDKKPRVPNTSIRWITLSSPLPTCGIEGFLYVNRDKHSFYIWDESNHKYIEFFGKYQNATNVTTNNDSGIVNNTIKNNSSYSFNLVNDALVITDSDGVVIEIPIPNEESINEKIRLLEERIEKLEGLLD